MSALTPYVAQAGLRTAAPLALRALSHPALAPKRSYNSSSKREFRNGRANWADNDDNNKKPSAFNNNNNGEPQRSSLSNDIKINFRGRPEYKNDRGAPVYFMDTLAWQAARATFGVYDLWNRSSNSSDRVDANRRLRWLKSIGGTQGLSGAAARQAWSLILGERNDGALTKTLTEDFNNERMHLLYAFDLANSTMITRFAALFLQSITAKSFAVAYFFSPRFVHRYLAHLQNDAVRAYDRLLKDPAAPEIVDTMNQRVSKSDRDYWNLAEDARVEDLVRVLREDADKRRSVHHSLADDNAGIGTLGSIKN